MEKMNMAAELLHCSREASVGLFVVITQFYDCDMTAPLSDEVLKRLEDGLQKLHDNNLVHGDLRRPNILADKEGCVRLIDFEWSGKAGLVLYPALLNPEITWPRVLNQVAAFNHNMTWIAWHSTRSSEMRALRIPPRVKDHMSAC